MRMSCLGRAALSMFVVMNGCKTGDEPFAEDDPSARVAITPSAASIRLVNDGSGGSAPTAAFTLVAADLSGRPREGAHIDVQIGYCDRSHDGAAHAQSMDTRLLLQAGTGCAAQSSAFLQCVLGVDGSATFSAAGAISSVANGPFYPVPIRAFPSGNPDPSRCSQAEVTVTTGLPAGTDLRVELESRRNVITATALACDAVTPLTCEGVRAWPFTVSLVGPNGAHVPIDQELTAEIWLTGANEDSWISPGGSCAELQRPSGVRAPIKEETGYFPVALALCSSARPITVILDASVTSVPGAVSLFTRVPVTWPPVPARLVWQSLPTPGRMLFAAYDCEGLAINPVTLPTFQQSGNLQLSARDVSEPGAAVATVEFTNVVPGVPIVAAYPEGGGTCSIDL